MARDGSGAPPAEPNGESVVTLSKAELDALKRDQKALQRLHAAGIMDETQANNLNRRPMYRDPETGEVRQMDLETETRLRAEAEGKKPLEVTVDPKTGRVTQTGWHSAHARFEQKTVDDRVRAEAIAAALTGR